MMMNRKSSAITSACIGVAIGAAAYMATGRSGKSLKSRSKKFRKSTGRALRQAGDFINSVSYMVK
ncbi:MAG: hypothetical protein FWE32_08035 [Oscillospiraceae bacterium]|nr:hypothetical protein [Oscillospiraceae bacterium]